MSRFIFILLFSAFIIQPSASCAEPAKATSAYIEKLFLEGKYERVVNEAGDLYYIKGLAHLKLNKFKDARESFKKVMSRAARSKDIFDAYIGIGDAYFLEDD